jgi:Flp pilus assembly protein TadD
METRHMKTYRSLIVVLLAALVTGYPAVTDANLGGEEVSESTDPNWIEGKKAVEAQDWKRAVELLSKAAAAEPNNADVQNWLGFSLRKSGNLDAAFAAYNEALKLNPQHKSAHEYIGEAYLLAGNIAKAEQHLTELQKLCTPIPCEEYKELRRALDEYKKNHK